MPRIAGQIDISKNEAILDAALAVLAERGVSVSMEEIARRAGVSKQTIYNHYGSKAELVRTMAERRVHEMVAPLETAEAAENPEQALAQFGRMLLDTAVVSKTPGLYRTVILNAPEMPDVAQAMWEAGPKASRAALAQFLALETKAGRLFCPNPAEAAEFFAGMVIGSYQTAWLLGMDSGLTPERIDRIAREASMRFMRAYAA
jgi:AcrR family transcriptional regulator